MKAILLNICLVCMSAIVFAQTSTPTTQGTPNSTVTYGIMGGVNFSYLDAKNPTNGKDPGKFIEPFSFGINADFALGNNISVRPALYYSGKGGNITNTVSTVNPGGGRGDLIENENIKLNYFEVPVTFIDHLPAGKNCNILIGVGPYIAYGLNSKVITNVDGSQVQTSSLDFGSNGELHRVDFGGTGLLGIEVNHISIAINYDLGLTNVIQNNDLLLPTSAKTGALYLSVGYSFK